MTELMGTSRAVVRLERSRVEPSSAGWRTPLAGQCKMPSLLDCGVRLVDGFAPVQPRWSLRAQHMAQRSAGILMYRWKDRQPELFLVHPGGPFWARKDDGAWSIPKGLYEKGEDPLAAAKREFAEETGCVPQGRFFELGSFRQPSGKQIRAWAVEGDCDLSNFKSNLFSMEWPPKSGRMQDFPEADRAAWFRPHEAMRKVLKGQQPILTTLLERLGFQSAAATRQSSPGPEKNGQGSLF